MAGFGESPAVPGGTRDAPTRAGRDWRRPSAGVTGFHGRLGERGVTGLLGAVFITLAVLGINHGDALLAGQLGPELAWIAPLTFLAALICTAACVEGYGRRRRLARQRLERGQHSRRRDI